MRINLDKARKIIIIIALLILAGGTGFAFGRQTRLSWEKGRPEIKIEREVPRNLGNVDFSLFWDVWDRLDASYLDQKALDYQKMVYGAISGMVSSLGDPYTVFLPPVEQKLSKEDLAGSFEGVGIQLGFKDSKIAVIAPLTGTPAQKAGIKAGDLILRIKDEQKGTEKETQGMTLPEAVELIRGPKGTKIVLTLSREGQEKPFEVVLVRETIVVQSVEVSFRETIAYLKLSRFGERTYQEWEEAVRKIEERKAELKGVVLDLRNNPGGFLQGAVFIASEFLPASPSGGGNGVVVKQEKSENGGVETFSVNRLGKLLTIPLVVLVNQGSASASEIVAGALQEKGRARVVGEKSFGKGTIQEAEELPDGAGLHITVARWLLPSGKSIDKEGVKPDFEVKMDESDSPSGEAGQTKDPQLEKAMEILNSKEQ